MKKFIHAVSSTGLALATALSISVALPAPAQAGIDDGSAKDIVAFCKDAVEGTDYSVGDCVSLFRQNGAVALCRILIELGVPFKNQGECVSLLRHVS